MIKKFVLGLTIMVGVLLLYLLFWPVPIQPIALISAEPPPLTGIYQPNDRLKKIERLGDGIGFGPEAVAFDAQGRIYTGMENGNIIRFEANASKHDIFANTKGRPLGMEFDATGNLIVADAEKGLLSVAPDGTITVLADKADAQPILFADDLDIASDGIIYFSDASIYPITDKMVTELMDGRPHGRLLAYDPKSKTTRVLLNDLYFANGVTLSPDESFVLVNETVAYRITRYWLTGQNQGQSDFFIENLPGVPDNISHNGRETYWLALISQRIPALEFLQAHPFIRKIIMRLPSAWQPTPTPTRYGFVLGLSQEGKVIHNLQDPSGEFASVVTSVKEHDGMLYLGTISDSAIKRITAP
jgi:sugar lactone lactonase YvrE